MVLFFTLMIQAGIQIPRLLHPDRVLEDILLVILLLQDIQEETNHLWAFAREVGLDYRTEGRIYINDLWELLFR